MLNCSAASAIGRVCAISSYISELIEGEKRVLRVGVHLSMVDLLNDDVRSLV